MPFEPSKSYRCEILSEWETVDGIAPDGSAGNRSVLERILRDGQYMWSNLRDGGQPNVVPDPNVCSWAIDEVNGAGLNEIESDSRCLILWAEELMQ